MAISHTNSIGFAPSMNDAEHGVVVADRVAIPAEKGDAHLQLSAACTAEPRAGAIAIIGAGNAARSLACYLARQGYSSQLLVRSPHKVTALMERLRITSRGQLEGEFEISKVSDDIESTLNKCRTVFVATTTDAYREIAFRLAPHLTPDHEVILFSSKFAGAVEFKNVLSMAISDLPKIVETDAIFASRIQEDDSIWIRGIKKWTLYSSWNCTETERTAESILRFFPELGRADNIIQRGLTDFGALAHPITMIANMNSVDRNTGFLFYYEGFTEKTIILMERLEEEFCALA